MAKFMLQASYNVEGAKGLLKEGGVAREKAVAKLVESMGGKLEAFYFAFGEDDVVFLVDAPDNASAAAASITAVQARCRGPVQRFSLRPKRSMRR